MSEISLPSIETPQDGAILAPVYLVGKDADGAEAGGRDTKSSPSGKAGNGLVAPANGNGRHEQPDLDEVRAEAARRAATELAAATLNASDSDTASHSDDVDVLAEGLCREFGITGRERENIIAAARLHDIGKVAIPPQVLGKPGPLNDAEWAVMRRHTVVGQQILEAVPEMEEVARLVRHSHERWDGEGYPDGIADEEIPLGSRIVACADAYHAVRSDRAYRRGRSAKAALAEIMSCAGTQFDPDVTDALAHLVEVTRAEAVTANGHRNYRSTRLAALLLALALGVGASAIAQFVGSPFAPDASAKVEPTMPVPAAGPPFELPDLSDLPIFDLAATGAGTSEGSAQPAGGDEGESAAPAGNRDRRPDNQPPGEGRVMPIPAAPGSSRDTDDSRPPESLPANSNPGHGSTSTPPTPPSSSGGGGNGDGGGGTAAHEPAGGPPPTPPGQVPGANPGHGGLPPGNPLAPGHQPQGTPGHGAAPVPGQGGTAPGQTQKDQRAALAGS